MPTPHVNDIGTVIALNLVDETNTPVDISGALSKLFYFVKPDATVVTKTAVFTNTGTDGKLQYVTAANDLNQPGNWDVQAYVDLGASGKWFSDFFQFYVAKNAQ